MEQYLLEEANPSSFSQVNIDNPCMINGKQFFWLELTFFLENLLSLWKLR